MKDLAMMEARNRPTLQNLENVVFDMKPEKGTPRVGLLGASYRQRLRLAPRCSSIFVVQRRLRRRTIKRELEDPLYEEQCQVRLLLPLTMNG